MAPTLAPGKICYIQIPADDVDRSVRFYETVFGWNIRRRSHGEVAFDDRSARSAALGSPGGRPPPTLDSSST